MPEGGEKDRGEDGRREDGLTRTEDGLLIAEVELTGPEFVVGEDPDATDATTDGVVDLSVEQTTGRIARAISPEDPTETEGSGRGDEITPVMSGSSGSGSSMRDRLVLHTSDAVLGADGHEPGLRELLAEDGPPAASSCPQGMDRDSVLIRMNRWIEALEAADAMQGLDQRIRAYSDVMTTLMFRFPREDARFAHFLRVGLEEGEAGFTEEELAHYGIRAAFEREHTTGHMAPYFERVSERIDVMKRAYLLSAEASLADQEGRVTDSFREHLEAACRAIAIEGADLLGDLQYIENALYSQPRSEARMSDLQRAFRNFPPSAEIDEVINFEDELMRRVVDLENLIMSYAQLGRMDVSQAVDLAERQRTLHFLVVRHMLEHIALPTLFLYQSWENEETGAVVNAFDVLQATEPAKALDFALKRFCQLLNIKRLLGRVNNLIVTDEDLLRS